MKLQYALDTNIISRSFRLDAPPDLVDRLGKDADHCAVPVPVWQRLRYGAERLPASRRRTALERFLEEVVLATYPLIPYDKPAAEWHAVERARLEKAGITAPLMDGVIAAIAKVNGLILVTDNTRDFRVFRGLRLQNWLR